MPKQDRLTAAAKHSGAAAGEKKPRFRRGGGANQAGYKTTTVRLDPDGWAWLRRTALERALETGGPADASGIIRELIAAAVKKGAR